MRYGPPTPRKELDRSNTRFGPAAFWGTYLANPSRGDARTNVGGLAGFTSRDGRPNVPAGLFGAVLSRGGNTHAAVGPSRLVLIHDATSAHLYRFEMHVPAGGRTVVYADGSATVYDARGIAVRRVARPWAFDAAGRPQKTWYTVDGATGDLIQHVIPAKNALYPILADPTDTPTWMVAGVPPTGPYTPEQQQRINAVAPPPAPEPQPQVEQCVPEPTDTTTPNTTPTDTTTPPRVVPVDNPTTPDTTGGGQPPPPPAPQRKLAPLGQVLTEAHGRQPGDTWTTTLPDGSKIINTIPPGNGDQTVDQTVIGPDGKVQSQHRVTDNGDGGYQRWTTNADGSSGYQTQMADGTNVDGMSWNAGIDPATGNPNSAYQTNWDGTQYRTVGRTPDGQTVVVDSNRDPSGQWTHRTIGADGTTTLTTSTDKGTDTVVRGQVDRNGTGWFTGEDGQRVETFIDGNHNPVYITTDQHSGNKTYVYTDTRTGKKRANVWNPQGRQVGYLIYNDDGSIDSGRVPVEGGSAQWDHGQLTIYSNYDHTGSRADNPSWLKMWPQPDGSAIILMTDGTKVTVKDDKVIKTEAPFDDRNAITKIGDAVGENLVGSWDAARSLVGLGPYGTADSWKGLAESVYAATPISPAYDGVRSALDDNYIGRSLGDNIAGPTNLLLGVDFRDFAGEDPYKAGTDLGIGILTWLPFGKILGFARAGTTAARAAETADRAAEVTRTARAADNAINDISDIPTTPHITDAPGRTPDLPNGATPDIPERAVPHNPGTRTPTAPARRSDTEPEVPPHPSRKRGIYVPKPPQPGSRTPGRRIDPSPQPRRAPQSGGRLPTPPRGGRHRLEPQGSRGNPGDHRNDDPTGPGSAAGQLSQSAQDLAKAVDKASDIIHKALTGQPPHVPDNAMAGLPGHTPEGALLIAAIAIAAVIHRLRGKP